MQYIKKRSSVLFIDKKKDSPSGMMEHSAHGWVYRDFFVQ